MRLLCMRMRLLLGRSYTASVRKRFPANAAAAAASDICPHPSCAAASMKETIEHLLLECPYYDAARNRLQAGLARHELGVDHIVNILNPPERSSSAFTKLLALTNAYLRAIAATREQLRLPSLDDCPTYAVPLPQLPPPTAAARRPAPPAAAALHADAAPLPLDTG
jgi:hypothetical protein